MNIQINQISSIFVSLYQPFYILAFITAVVFVISGFTDFFYDLYHIGWVLRRMVLGSKWSQLTLDRLKSREQQKVAIFIAAWHEADVIAQTLINATRTIQYRNYDIFVGTYPNDLDTQREVDRVAEMDSRVHKVITPEEGPTNKASNLNHVFKAMLDYEKRHDRFFDMIVMHDSEDIIHPYSLLVYNYLIPRMEMVQIPVFPISRPLRQVTHWTYADEFAENHTKILRVREITGGFVPSAGVGTAFTKRAFQTLALQHQEVFSPSSLTEDYQLGLQMNLRGMKAAFVNIKLQPNTQSEKTKDKSICWVATRALFPTDFKKAVKQKTRWNIGIVLQSWEQSGWNGSLSVKWNLFQDRKALIATPINFIAYFVFLYFILYLLVNLFAQQPMPVLIPKGTLLYTLVLIATGFMIWRSFNRAYAVQKVYGFWAAITSIPRVIWGNVINFFAILRAVWQYLINKFKQQEVDWDKTAHEFPADIAELNQQINATPVNNGFMKKEEKKEINLDYQIQEFNECMENGSTDEKVALLISVSRKYGELLYPYLINYINDPDWIIRAAVCRSLSFLRLPQAIPYLEKAATDYDWVVRSNAVRALGKLGHPGEMALFRLLHNEDRYAKDAARSVLEHQGFLDRLLSDLNGQDNYNARMARQQLKILANVGGSVLAQEFLENLTTTTENQSDTKPDQ